MRTLISLLVLSIFGPACTTSGSHAESDDKGTAMRLPAVTAKEVGLDRTIAEPAGARVTALGRELYRQMRQGDENLIISPASVHTALMMALVGARGTTLEEMAEVLGVEDSAKAHRGASMLLASWTTHQRGGHEVAMANAVFADDQIELRPGFEATLSTVYGAPEVRLALASAPGAAAREIIAWVEDRTRGRISQIVDGDVLSGARLVLVNALYFRGEWKDRFDGKNTAPAPFHLPSGEKVKVMMMRGKIRTARHRRFPEMHVVELPYAAGRFSMVVAVAHELDGFEAMEARILDDAAEDWMAQLRRGTVDVEMPCFSLATAQMELKDVLEALGMPSAFSPGKADFSGITADVALYITNVLQRVTVDVTETGTTATAATAVVLHGRGASVPPPVVKFDRPFIFAIVDRLSGATLFMGRVMDPR